MTKEEFIKELKEEVSGGRLKFRFDADLIRSDDGRCPICALSYLRGGPNFLEFPAHNIKHLSLEKEHASWVVNAADWADSSGRKELMEACGLS